MVSHFPIFLYVRVMLTLSALFAEMLSVIAVDDIAYQQQRERHKKYDGRKSVHLRCDRLFCHAVYTDGQRFKSVAGCEIADSEADLGLLCSRQDVQSDAEMYGSFPGCADKTAVAVSCLSM